MDLSRRNFMMVGVTSMVGLPGDSTELQQQEQPESTQTGAAQLAGSEADRPAIDSVFFENKEFYAYVFEALDSGRTYYTDDTMAEWQTLAVSGESLSLVATDLSTVDASDGEVYRHDGSSTITADGGSTASAGYYCWSESSAEWKTVVAF